MKTLLIHLDDSDYKLLEIVKGNNTWRELLLTLVRSKKGKQDG